LDDYAVIPVYRSLFRNVVSPRVQGYSIVSFGIKWVPYVWLAAPTQP